MLKSSSSWFPADLLRTVRHHAGGGSCVRRGPNTEPCSGSRRPVGAVQLHHLQRVLPASPRKLHSSLLADLQPGCLPPRLRSIRGQGRHLTPCSLEPCSTQCKYASSVVRKKSSGGEVLSLSACQAAPEKEGKKPFIYSTFAGGKDKPRAHLC